MKKSHRVLDVNYPILSIETRFQGPLKDREVLSFRGRTQKLGILLLS